MAKSKKPKAAKSSSEPRTELVDSYVGRLNAAGLHRAAFDQVVSDLQADKGARKVERLSIASKYVGVRLPSKASPLAEIRRRFVELARFERTLEIAAKGTPS
jgi:hypothetical protein